MKHYFGQLWVAPATKLVLVQCVLAATMAFASDFKRRPPLVESAPIAIIYVSLAMAYVVVRSRLPLRWALDENMLRLKSIVAGGLLLTVQFSLLSWSKQLMPIWSAGFWADPILADLDLWLFGTDPWLIARAIPADWFVGWSYWLWLFIVPFVIYAMLIKGNDQAVLAVFVITALGSFSQFLLPSSGPIFYQLAGWGDRFVPMHSDLTHPAQFWLWKFHLAGTVKPGIGISAMPSMHVAMAMWLWLVATNRMNWLAGAYFLVIWWGSVYIGLHYFTDGLVGALIALVAWKLCGSVQAVNSSTRNTT